MLTVLAVGNPGSGKSTVLNALTGAQNFEAGVSFGSGLTSKLHEVVVNGIRYADTPGVADDTYRQALFLCNICVTVYEAPNSQRVGARHKVQF